jgi:hypothetical protein
VKSRRRIVVSPRSARPQPCSTLELEQQAQTELDIPFAPTDTHTVQAMSGQAQSEYGPRRAAYDLKKLRGKGMVNKIGLSRRYEPIPEGLRAMTALLVLREKVIRPLLAASSRPEVDAKLNNPTPIDQHYETLRLGMRGLFNAWGIAA